MTYCLAWKTKSAVFLLADTSVTLNKSLRKSHSSFGELQGSQGSISVVESLLKINPLRKHAAIAFAGDVRVANSIIDSIRILLDSGESCRKAFEKAIVSNSPIPPSRSVSIILAYYENEFPMLAHFDSRQPQKIIDVEDVIQIGSMGSYYLEFSGHMIRSFIGGTSKPENILTAITAVVQTYGIHAVLSDMYVGGALFGLYIDQYGLNWQEDTTYVIYYDKGGVPNIGGFITVGVRDNVLFTASSLINETKSMTSHVSAENANSWIGEWQERILDILKNYHSEYYVFLSTQHRITTIVRTYGNITNEYFQVRPLGGNKVAILLHDKFYQLIRDFSIKKGDENGIPFQLAWLHATNADRPTPL